MRIRLTSGPKAGSIEHVSQAAAESLIVSGQAEAYPYKNYVDRLNDEQAQRTAAQPKEQDAWRVKESRDPNRLNVPVIVFYNATSKSTWHFDTPPSHAPKWVHEQYKALAAKLKTIPSREKTEREQQEQNAREQKENQLKYGVGALPKPYPIEFI